MLLKYSAFLHSIVQVSARYSSTLQSQFLTNFIFFQVLLVYCYLIYFSYSCLSHFFTFFLVAQYSFLFHNTAYLYKIIRRTVHLEFFISCCNNKVVRFFHYLGVNIFLSRLLCSH